MVSRLLAFAGAALLAAAAPAPAPTGTPIGESLSGEACALVARDDIAPARGLPNDRTIQCGGKSVGAVTYVAMPAGLASLAAEARQAQIKSLFLASRPWAQLRDRLGCEAPAWLQDGAAPALVLPCRSKSGGWPVLVVAATDRATVAGVETLVLGVADGPASSYPALRAAVKAPAPAASRPEMTARVEKLWRTPTVLASATDIDRLKTLLRDARTSNGVAKYDDAEEIYRQALQLQTQLFSANDTAAADIMMDLALNVSNQGRADEAAALFRQAAPIMEKSPADSDRARLNTYRGYEAANRGDFQSALKFAQAASASWRTLATAQAAAPGLAAAANINGNVAQGELAMARNLEALMLLRTGDVTGAYAAAGEALLILGNVSAAPRWWKADILTTLGEISIAQDRISAAETYFRNALTIRQQLFGEGTGTLRIRAALGRGYQTVGMNTAAIVAYRDAFKVARTLPRGAVPFTNQDLVPFAAAVVDYARSLDDPKERQGLYAEAFDAFQLVRSPLIDKTIAQSSARLSTANPEIATLLRDMGDRERAASIARIKLSYEQSLTPSERSAEVEARLTKEAASNRTAAAEIRRTLDAKYPDYASLNDQRPLTLDQLRARLGAHEGIASFLIGRDKSFIQLVRRDGIYIAAVPAGEAALRSSVEGLRRSLEIQGGSINEFDLASSNALYRDLFADIQPAMTGVDHLVVVPAGPLSSLPFALLVTEPPKNDDYRTASWLVNRITVSHTPSLAAFVALRSTRPAKTPDLPLLAFGDPTLGAAKTKGKLSALTALADACRQDSVMPASTLMSLASLPDTAIEMQTVARTLRASPSSVHMAGGASEAALRGEDLSRYRVLYFATHGLLPGELKCQTEPGLVLTPPAQTATTTATDGLLSASEVSAFSLNADLVVLSACNTAAGGKALGGEAMSGLSEAFFRAGARNMLVSHWQVPSAATTALMSGLFTTMAAPGATGAADALRASQLRLIANPQTAHPFFWAAFVLMGDGGGGGPVQTAENGK